MGIWKDIPVRTRLRQPVRTQRGVAGCEKYLPQKSRSYQDNPLRPRAYTSVGENSLASGDAAMASCSASRCPLRACSVRVRVGSSTLSEIEDIKLTTLSA